MASKKRRACRDADRLAGEFGGSLVDKAMPNLVSAPPRRRIRVEQPRPRRYPIFRQQSGDQDMDLNGKAIIVTGASSGIGRAAASLFAARGASVVLGARRAKALEDQAAEIRAAGGRAEALAGDVTDPIYARALVRRAETAFGGLDGAFNNAGAVGDLHSVPEMPRETWEGVLATNLTAAFFAAQAQLPALRARGGGSLVFTGSFVGCTRAGLPGMGAYAAAKAGLAGFARQLATEHGHEGIRVNALLPGGTRTPMAGDDPVGHAQIGTLHALGRIAEPREIAEAAAFLLSDGASFVTGSAMLADGGVSIRLV